MPVGAVLLTGLLAALEDWRGEPGAVVELEGHGRGEVPGDDVDLSYTVGWFASLFPVRFDEAATLRSVGATLASVPHRGASYGWLRRPPRSGRPVGGGGSRPGAGVQLRRPLRPPGPGGAVPAVPVPAGLAAGSGRPPCASAGDQQLRPRPPAPPGWAHGRHRHRAGTVEALAGTWPTACATSADATAEQARRGPRRALEGRSPEAPRPRYRPKATRPPAMSGVSLPNHQPAPA